MKLQTLNPNCLGFLYDDYGTSCISPEQAGGQAGRQATFAMYLVQAAARLFGLTILHCQPSSSSHDFIMSQAKSISKTQWIS